MRYLPKSPAEREQMLADIGASSIDDLFSTIPAEYRLTRDDIPFDPQGLLAIWFPGDAEQARWIASRFPGNAWAAIELHRDPAPALAAIAGRLRQMKQQPLQTWRGVRSTEIPPRGA